MEKTLSLLGRVLYAVPLAGFGFLHLMNSGEMAGMVPNFLSWGDIFFVIITGIALLMVTISMVINKFVKLSSFLLGVMFIILALSIHLVNVIGGDQISLGQLFKDLSLAGAAFFISAKSS